MTGVKTGAHAALWSMCTAKGGRQAEEGGRDTRVVRSVRNRENGRTMGKERM